MCARAAGIWRSDFDKMAKWRNNVASRNHVIIKSPTEKSPTLPNCLLNFHQIWRTDIWQTDLWRNDVVSGEIAIGNLARYAVSQ